MQATISGKISVLFLDVVAGADTIHDFQVDARSQGQVWPVPHAWFLDVFRVGIRDLFREFPFQGCAAYRNCISVWMQVVCRWIMLSR